MKALVIDIILGQALSPLYDMDKSSSERHYFGLRLSVVYTIWMKALVIDNILGQALSPLYDMGESSGDRHYFGLTSQSVQNE